MTIDTLERTLSDAPLPNADRARERTVASARARVRSRPGGRASRATVAPALPADRDRGHRARLPAPDAAGSRRQQSGSEAWWESATSAAAPPRSTEASLARARRS